MEELIREWEGEYFISRYDRPTGATIFIAVHSSRLGPPTGGTRLKAYETPRQALLDAMRLAQGMTYKWAVIDFPRGGGKAVIDVPGPLEPAARQGLMLRYGRWLSQLNGLFETGPDLGTGPEDMAIIARHFAGVYGLPAESGGAGSSGPATALGVFSAIQAGCLHLFGTQDLGGRTVLVQGSGSVGETLIRLLLEAGATVKFAETDGKRASIISDHFGIEAVDPAAVYDEECEIFSPCATGGILNKHSIARLRCRFIAGAANNQLAEPEDGERLHRRGILYAPDYVINSGGAIYLTTIQGMGWDAERANERIRRIGRTLQELLALAQNNQISPAMAAGTMAREHLDRKPAP